jgi:hypothetical protein
LVLVSTRSHRDTRRQDRAGGVPCPAAPIRHPRWRASRKHCDLHRGRAHRARGAVNEHALALAQAGARQVVERRRAAEAERRGLLVGQVLRLGRHRIVFGHAAVLGMAAHAGAGEREHRIARLEARDARAHRVYLARQLGAEHRTARAGEPERRPRQRAEAARQPERSHAHVARTDGGGAHPDQQLVGLRHGHRPLGPLQQLGSAIGGADHGLHGQAARPRALFIRED